MFVLSAASLLLIGLVPARAQNVTTDHYLSRPDINPPGLFVKTFEPSLVGAGYIFLTPSSPEASNFTFGSYIYNDYGARCILAPPHSSNELTNPQGLVWDGTSFNAPDHDIADFYVCGNYQAQPHLCMTMYQGVVSGGVSRDSYSLIIDNTYKQVHAVAPSAKFNGQTLTTDVHEFNVVGATGASALGTSYAVVHRNATVPACSGSPSVEWITTGLFTETSTDGLNTTIFSWNALDHVAVMETHVCPGDNQAGGGTAQNDGFDFFHINALDKNSDGDYLVSGRHTWTLYKIAGLNSPSGLAAGSIIWRLGGKKPTITNIETAVPNAGTFNFSFQHHARFSNTGVTLWDNANNNIEPPSALASSGMSVDINESNNTATLVAQAVPPSERLDFNQGSYQTLPNGNHFCGLGGIAEIFERTANGTLAFNAFFGRLPIQSYRAFRYTWSGFPAASQMALFMYAPSCGGGNAFHATWNGATNVASYRFFVSNSTSNSTFTQAGTAPKTWLFETSGVFSTFGQYGYFQAIDANGTVMATSPVIKNFVPGPQLAATCSNVQCPVGTNYTTALQANCSYS